MSDQSSFPSVTPLIAALPSTVPFTGPEAIERKTGRLFTARLGANENGFGPAPSVIEALKNSLDQVWKYGDPENYDLINALAKTCGLKTDQITIGAGIDSLLGLIVRQYIEPGDVVVNSLGGYPTFNYHVAGFGGKLISVPYSNDRTDLAALSEAVHKNNAKIVYIANPDNPLGTWHDSEEIDAFIQNLPETTLCILDEAYGELAPKDALPPLSKIWPNVLRMRTFSKAYGLAGLRCGYTIGMGELIGIFDKVRDHFSINKMAQIAAFHALADKKYLDEVIGKINFAKSQLVEIANSHGLKTLPSATNFVAIDCGRDGSYAQTVLDGLIERGIFVRKPSVPVLDRLIRVSVGTTKEMDLFAEAFASALSAADKG
ncbi:pyridoxal phosphate-dependent aminotransferase [uncultured Bartonella sp.]|uniref:pyridoxal phosphate-dependent aminotransferase n=1 Tax=uncultured Bartonella sp. TaxID=104108 RepID=UPI00262BE940|nr:pyridoxal phosphate-dependent aminotransferase [uncultured Bartonella sp.]